MKTGYESSLGDIRYLFDVASDADRQRLATRLNVRIEKRGNNCAFFEHNGAIISLEEIHRRTQADPDFKRSVYNLWMTYAH